MNSIIGTIFSFLFTTPLGILTIALLFFFAFGVRIINTRETAIVEFLGKYKRMLSPGFNVIIPILESIAQKASLKTQSLKLGVDGYTKDNVALNVGIDVLYYIEDDSNSIYNSYYKVENPKGAIKSIIDNSLRSKINTFDYKEVLEKRDEFGDFLEEILGVKLKDWGYKIDSIQITDINLPKDLVKAMNDVKTSEREMEAATNKGEAAKILEVKKAEAEKETMTLKGEGIASQREEIAKGLKASVEEFKSAMGNETNVNEIMNIILTTNYFDTLKDMAENGAGKIIFADNSPGAVGSIKDSIIKGIEGSRE